MNSETPDLEAEPLESARDELHRLLASISVRAWRLHLNTPGAFATVPRLRGTWGRALRDESLSHYASIFEESPDSPPRYLMRPAPASAQPAPALEFLLFGENDDLTLAVIAAAWDRASRYGLGAGMPPFHIEQVRPLAWDGTPLQPSWTHPGFNLARLPWPLGNPNAACELAFPAPLRLIRDRRLIQRPTLPDLAATALRRFQALAGPSIQLSNSTRQFWLEQARSIPALPWQGHRLDLQRYSGSQRREIELQGVSGTLTLPTSPGPLQPLLAAAQWTHLGKGTVMGLGQLQILDPSSREKP